MENEPTPDFSFDEPAVEPPVFPAYHERWDGRRMIPNNYIDPFLADKDDFLTGIEGVGYDE